LRTLEKQSEKRATLAKYLGTKDKEYLKGIVG
jgi:hypothetical protein